MASTYNEAAAVLVLDSGFQSCLSETSIEEKLLSSHLQLDAAPVDPSRRSTSSAISLPIPGYAYLTWAALS